MARGPLASSARARLQAQCRSARKHRSLCELPSLTRRACLLPEHDNSKEHSSGVRYVSACNCGRTKCPRDDPYTVRAANCGFYEMAARECAACPTLVSIDFPVFQPSTPTYRAASVKGASSQEAVPVRPAEDPDPEAEAEAEAEADGPWSEADALSPGSAHDDDNSSASDKYVVPLRGECTEKAISRQPSTTEYLPGMLHVGSPGGLLPAFASWSLVCVGAASLYSHGAGLPEHLQPGFLPHTNFLLPWDAAVRMEQASLFRTPAARGRGKPAPHHLTVKIFIGFEYECPRGHRFMMSSPDTVVNGGGCVGGRGSGAGARLAGADMPLGGPCPCRPPHAPARLQRVHVVTPKAPVHVTIDPKVQPVPGGPIFVPRPAGEPPIKLSASAYWVLRLPYVYCDEKGVLPRTKTHGTQQRGVILAPLFGLQD